VKTRASTLTYAKGQGNNSEAAIDSTLEIFGDLAKKAA